MPGIHQSDTTSPTTITTTRRRKWRLASPHSSSSSDDNTNTKNAKKGKITSNNTKKNKGRTSKRTTSDDTADYEDEMVPLQPLPSTSRQSHPQPPAPTTSSSDQPTSRITYSTKNRSFRSPSIRNLLKKPNGKRRLMDSDIVDLSPKTPFRISKDSRETVLKRKRTGKNKGGSKEKIDGKRRREEEGRRNREEEGRREEETEQEKLEEEEIEGETILTQERLEEMENLPSQAKNRFMLDEEEEELPSLNLFPDVERIPETQFSETDNHNTPTTTSYQRRNWEEEEEKRREEEREQEKLEEEEIEGETILTQERLKEMENLPIQAKNRFLLDEEEELPSLNLCPHVERIPKTQFSETDNHNTPTTTSYHTPQTSSTLTTASYQTAQTTPIFSHSLDSTHTTPSIPHHTHHEITPPFSHHTPSSTTPTSITSRSLLTKYPSPSPLTPVQNTLHSLMPVPLKTNRLAQISSTSEVDVENPTQGERSVLTARRSEGGKSSAQMNKSTPKNKIRKMEIRKAR